MRSAAGRSVFSTLPAITGGGGPNTAASSSVSRCRASSSSCSALLTRSFRLRITRPTARCPALLVRRHRLNRGMLNHGQGPGDAALANSLGRATR